MSATETAPWSIRKARHVSDWVVQHPTMHQHRYPKLSFFPTHAEALAFVLAQPEVSRRTSSAAKAHELAAEALS